jgi:ABC-type uncharacterized transport system permease subunit
LTFFMGGNGDHARLGFDAVTMLTFYPIDFFGAALKFAVYTVLPVGFITGLPLTLVEDFSIANALGLTAVALGFALVARVAFYAGLRRYRSGSQWT